MTVRKAACRRQRCRHRDYRQSQQQEQHHTAARCGYRLDTGADGLTHCLRHLLQLLSCFAGGGFRLLEHLPLGGALGVLLCPLLGGGHSSRRRFLCRLARHWGSVLRRGGLLR